MLSVSEVIEKYVYDKYRYTMIELNRDPVKFNINLELNSVMKFITEYKEDTIIEVLSHMTLNSLQSMSGIPKQGKEILEKWDPEKPPTLTYRTRDYNYGARIYIEDEGMGINPYIVVNHIGFRRKMIRKIRKKNKNDPRRMINYIFKEGVTTKGTGGWGLTKSQVLMRRIRGEIRIHGTTYSDLGNLVTLLTHPGKKTGATFSIDIRYPRDMRYKKKKEYFRYK